MKNYIKIRQTLEAFRSLLSMISHSGSIFCSKYTPDNIREFNVKLSCLSRNEVMRILEALTSIYDSNFRAISKIIFLHMV